jgi:hypothetical protein
MGSGDWDDDKLVEGYTIVASTLARLLWGGFGIMEGRGRL